MFFRQSIARKLSKIQSFNFNKAGGKRFFGIVGVFS